MSEDITRRDFVRLSTLGCAALAGLAGCSASNAPSEGAKKNAAVVKNADGTVTVKSGGKLAAGQTMSITLPNGEPAILVASKPGEVVALSAICTHAGCQVAWRSDEKDFHCPCHNSKFDAQGKPVSGPAKAPLPRFEARIQGDDAILSIKS